MLTNTLKKEEEEKRKRVCDEIDLKRVRASTGYHTCGPYCTHTHTHKNHNLSKIVANLTTLAPLNVQLHSDNVIAHITF